MGSIRKRSGRYQAQVRRQGVQAVSRTFTTKKDALIWVRGIEAHIDVGEINVAAPKALNLGDLLERYREEVTPQKKGASTETRRLDRLLKDPISTTPLPKLTRHALATFRDRRVDDGLRAAQIDLSIIRHCWNIAVKEWEIPLPSNPVSEIRVPNEIKHRDRRLREGEFEKLKEAAKLSQNIYLWPMVQFAIFTAMRRSEILNMRWEDISMSGQVAHLIDTKNGTASQCQTNLETVYGVTHNCFAVLRWLPEKQQFYGYKSPINFVTSLN